MPPSTHGAPRYDPDELTVDTGPVGRPPPSWHAAPPHADAGPLAGVRRWVYGIGIVLSVIVIVRQVAEVARVMPQLRSKPVASAVAPVYTVQYDAPATGPAAATAIEAPAETTVTATGEVAPQLIVAFGGALAVCAAIVLIGSIMGLSGVRSARMWVFWPAAVWGLVALVATACAIGALEHAIGAAERTGVATLSQYAMYAGWLAGEVVYPVFCVVILSRRG
ncbi:MAG: hypothetical protein ACAI43_01610 [Phycisphaerae bacterium]|nr:hypothetical protein [Tepidisphaeraceae bacterium]